VDIIAWSLLALYTLVLNRQLTAPIAFASWIVIGLLHAKIMAYPVRTTEYRAAIASVQRFETMLQSSAWWRAQTQSTPEKGAATTLGIITVFIVYAQPVFPYKFLYYHTYMLNTDILTRRDRKGQCRGSRERANRRGWVRSGGRPSSEGSRRQL
jgi:hypothetical protein